MQRSLVLVALSLTACSKKTLDMEKFETDFKSRADGMGFKNSTVSCPNDIKPEVGGTFTCKITIEGSSYDMNFTIKSLGDRVETDSAWARGRPVVRHKLVERAPKVLADAVGIPATVDCGTEPLIFLENLVAKCKATFGTQTVGLVLTFNDKLEIDSWATEPKMLRRQTMEVTLTKLVAEKQPGSTVTCGTDHLLPLPDTGVVMCEATTGTEKRPVEVTVNPDMSLKAWKLL